MNNIGKRIKEYRKKKDITQEKLAEYLNISSQAVSKWETGVAIPDISMLIPLSRLLNVSTDELLGIESDEKDEKQEQLIRNYHSTFQSGDTIKRYEICKTLAEEYPGNFEFLLWLAQSENSFAWHNCKESKEKCEVLETAAKHFGMIIDDCNDTSLRNSALHGIVLTLKSLGKKQKAIPYAKQHPDSRELLMWCLDGEDKEKQRQLLITVFLDKLIWYLQFGHNNLSSLNAAIKVIETIFDDHNYLYYNDKLMHIYMWKAMCLAKENRTEETIEALKKSYKHANDFINFERELKNKDLCFTGSVVNKIKFSNGDINHSGNTNLVEDFYEYLSNNVFDEVRSKINFI